jgi:hypothetical protein
LLNAPVSGSIDNMTGVLTRNAALLVGLALAGVICVMAAPFMASGRGGAGPTLLAAERPVTAAFALLATLAVATALASVVGRITNTAVGLFVLGAGVFALNGRMGTVRDLVFAEAGRSTLTLLAVEALILVALATGMVLGVFRLTGGFRDVEPNEHHERPHWLASDAALRSAACGIFVLPAVWLIAQSPMKGQAMAAVIVGGTVAGLVARLIAPHVQPVLIFITPVLFGAIGYLLASVSSRPPLDHAYILGSLSVFARVLPLDYLAGSLLGVAMGLGWAKSFLHHEQTSADAQA